MLPCHMDPTYDPYTAGMQTLQCAGAAIFRANCGLEMPSAFIKAVVDTDKVFATPAELIAHHRHITIEAAEKILRKKPPGILLAEELHRAAQSARGKLILTPTKE